MNTALLLVDAHSRFDGKLTSAEAIARLNRNVGAIAEVTEAGAVWF